MTAPPAMRAACERVRSAWRRVRTRSPTTLLAWFLVFGLANGSEGTVPSCRGGVSVSVLGSDPQPPASVRARQDRDGVRAHWLSDRRVVLLPTAPGLRINGAAGLEVHAPALCAVTLQPGYHRGVDIASRHPIATVGLAVCGEGADEACVWIDLDRPF